MYCRECGEKLILRYCENEGLVLYCNRCEQFKFTQFYTAVSMVVTNRAQDKILLARHTGEEDFILFAGYIKKGESAEKAVVREMKEETRLNVIKSKYMSSKFHEPKEVLMLNFIAVVEDSAPITLKADELSEVKWFTVSEAKEIIRKNSTAEYFLLNAADALRKKI